MNNQNNLNNLFSSGLFPNTPTKENTSINLGNYNGMSNIFNQSNIDVKSGSRDTQYTPQKLKDERGFSTLEFNHINIMKEYSLKSCDEIRWEDYNIGRRPNTSLNQVPLQSSQPLIPGTNFSQPLIPGTNSSQPTESSFNISNVKTNSIFNPQAGSIFTNQPQPVQNPFPVTTQLQNNNIFQSNEQNQSVAQNDIPSNVSQSFMQQPFFNTAVQRPLFQDQTNHNFQNQTNQSYQNQTNQSYQNQTNQNYQNQTSSVLYNNDSQNIYNVQVDKSDPYGTKNIKFHFIEKELSPFQRLLAEPISKDLQKLPVNSNLDYRDPEDEKEMDFYSIPSFNEIRGMNRINNFTLVFPGKGKVEYLEPVKVSDLTIENINKKLLFNREHVYITDKPGHGLNLSARVTVEKFYPASKTDDSLIIGKAESYPNKGIQDRFIYELKNDQYKKFEDYDCQTGIYIYQSLKILPNIKYLLENGKEQEAISIINSNIDSLALYMKDYLGLFSGSSSDSLLCLSKIHFILQNYEESIDFALKAGDLFLNDKTFYSKALIDRMMLSLISNRNHICKKFILQLIESDKISDNKIGYLFQIEEFDLFEKAFSKRITNIPFLKYICNEVKNKDRFYHMIIKINNQETKETLFVLTDAFMHFNMIKEVKSLILKLEASDICLCYNLCFYVRECYKLNLHLENEKLNLILSGEFKKEIFTKFLVAENVTSFKFLDSIAKARSPHISLVNSLMNLGTTNDTFYRNNSDIFCNMKEWSRYSDISNLGMIHYNSDNPYEILKNYIPNESTNKEGGSLQALGLINNGTNNEADNELLLYFLEAEEFLSEELVFGVCMGLGLINVGSNNNFIIDKLKKLEKFKNTIFDEATTIGIGLLGCGTQDFNLLKYLRILEEDSTFERVKRTIGLSNALIVGFSKSIHTIEDPFGYVLSIGTAFVGTGDLEMISKLLPYINHEDDDVKRNAVISLGLICCLEKDLLIKTLEPLAENHNFAVRSGVGITLGFFFSGTGNEKVCDLLEGLIYDSNPLVKQSSLIGIGLVIMQCNQHLVKNYKRIINRINKIIIDRSEDSSVKFGAMLGRGLSEAGGRNVIFNITNLCNKITNERLAGTVLFLNYWYWYPFISCISLTMKETGFFVFNENLELVNQKINYTKNYDNILIKVPDVKKSRKFKAKPVVEEEIVTKADEEILSGGRCTFKQMEECKIDFPGVFFIKK